MLKFRRKIVAPDIELDDGTIGTDEIANAAVTVSKADTALKTKSVPINIGDISASDNKFIFAAPVACVISDIGVIVDTADATDGTNYWTFQVSNLTQSSTMLNSTILADSGNKNTNIVADTLTSIGTLTNTSIATNDVLELQITKAASADTLGSLACMVEYY